MVVQHNMQAMNANRMLGITAGSQAKSTEKLSSGYKINRAADDAAGLTISEKMRKQIRGLDRAATNAEDGVSAVQTAEGALTEVHDMLQRMNELATQAANGTNSESDRQAIQAEIDQLVTEIDRVAETTKFNETYLLKGDGTKGTKTLNAHDAGLKGSLADAADDKGKAVFTADALSVGSKVSIGGTEYTIVGSSKADDYQSIKEYSNTEGDKLIQNGVAYTYDTTDSKWKDADGNETTMRDGDTIVTDGKTKTVVGNANTALDTAPNTISWAAGDTVEADGKTYTYYAANTTGNSVAGFYENTPANNAAAADYTVAGGEEYTIAATGKTGTVPSPNGIATIDGIQEKIKTLSAGDTVKIGSKLASDGTITGDEYTVGVTTKEDGTAYTADDIAELVKEGMYVNDGTNTYYSLPSASERVTEISLNEAYDKMAEALKAASDIGADETTLSEVKNNGDGTFEITKGKVAVDNGLSFNLHVGADADMTNKINVNIDSMSAAGLGIKGINVMDETGADATYAIDAISDAIATVSSQRSALGAVQNRLEHTIANLDNVVENTTSAESRIRDTDMAEEMVNYSKNSILQQAGQSMLAQANQANQGVLSLLS